MISHQTGTLEKPILDRLYSDTASVEYSGDPDGSSSAILNALLDC